MFIPSSKSDFQKHISEDHFRKEDYNAGFLICSDCDYITKRKDTLREHFETKHRQILFSCEECNFQTFNPRFFRKHQFKGHKGNTLKRKLTYTCFHCDFSVTRPTLLKTHTISSHKEEMYR